jgi:hypothetical protein
MFTARRAIRIIGRVVSAADGDTLSTMVNLLHSLMFRPWRVSPLLTPAARKRIPHVLRNTGTRTMAMSLSYSRGAGWRHMN